MSLTPQRTRTKTETPTSGKSMVKTGNWSKCFPTKFSTETSSCTFVKKLLTVAVSNITYLRSMFPEQAYANRSLDELPLKILKGNNDCPEAQSLANWLMGAFDALEKKYLREMMLVVYKDQANPDTVEEVYTFKFSYPDGQASCQLLQGQEGKEKTITADDIYKSTQNLLRTLVVLTQGLDPLNDSMMTMKLTYYDSVTPSDYEPAGFLPTPLVEPQLPAGSVLLQSGQVSTLHHSVQLGVKAVAGQHVHHDGQHDVQHMVEANPEQDVNIQAPAAASQHKKLVSSTSSKNNQNISTTPSSCLRSHLVPPPGSEAPSSISLLGEPSPSLPPSSSRSHLGLQTQPSQAPSSVSLLSEQSMQDSSISCLCTNTHPDPLMLRCTYCSYLQHGACYRIISADNIPTTHCCVTCSMEQGVPCTDTKLVKMSSNPAVTHTCLFRRVLAILLQVDMVNTELMVDKLGVEPGTAVAVLKKLVEDRCLVEDEEEGQLKVLKEILVGSVLPKYLGRKGGKTSKQPRAVVEDGGLAAGGDQDEKKSEEKDVKCSVVAGTHQVPRYQFKRSLIKESREGTSKRLPKRKKVSEVKGNLQI